MTAIAAMFAMSVTSAPRLRTCTGLAMPAKIGPILVGMAKPVHVLSRGADVTDIANIATIAVIDAQDAQLPAT